MLLQQKNNPSESLKHFQDAWRCKDRRLKHFQDAWRGRINSSGSLQNFDRIRLDERAYIKNEISTYV